MIPDEQRPAPPRRELLFGMRRIRAVEETIAERYAEGRMRCPVHLSTGQEAVSAAVGLVLRPTDLAVSGHRAHAHYLAKGGSLPRMLAELYGKATGCSRGKGGSMHLIDEGAGFKGSTAIVGGTVPIGTGLGLSIKRRGTDQVACVFLGDAVVEEGVFFESVNFAVLHRLPVLYVCENNLYSVYSPLSVRQPAGRAIHAMVAGLGITTGAADGNDPEAVFFTCAEQVCAIRSGGGPAFLEYSTYRWREHCGPNFDNDIGYRTEAEYLAWKERDPVATYARRLLQSRELTEIDIDAMDREIAAEVRDAFVFAENSPFPSATTAGDHVYARGETSA
jgi:TPP-dependent pyruvate/acetoin dehydrogenase alpha subunit